MAIAYRTVKDLKLNTPAVLRATRRHDVVITLHGKPVAILRRFTPAELEATVLLQSKGLRARLRKALDRPSPHRPRDLAGAARGGECRHSVIAARGMMCASPRTPRRSSAPPARPNARSSSQDSTR